MGPETVAVRRTYLERGVASRQRLPDDHIALELALMAHLSDGIADARDKGDDGRCKELRDAQEGFLGDHLLPWGPAFCSKVLAATPNEFFIGLARLPLACLEHDRNRLAAGGAGIPPGAVAGGA